MTGPRILALGIFGLIAATGPAAAQGCAPPGHAAIVGGLAHYDLGDGIDAVELGLDGALDLHAVSVGLQAVRVGFPDTELDLTAARVRLAYPLHRLDGWEICLTGHGGLAWMADFEDDATMLAGGAGLGVARRLRAGPADLTARLTGRGLAGATTGSIEGEEVAAVGFSLGVAGGLDVVLGPFLLRIGVALDGLAPALGPTPFPHRAVRLSAGYRF